MKHLKLTECSRKRFSCTTCYNIENHNFMYHLLQHWNS